KKVILICACRTLLVSLLPQRVILTQFGRYVIHDSLVATLTRYSLINDAVCESVARLFKNHKACKTCCRLACLTHTNANTANNQRVLRGRCGEQRQGWRSAGVEPRTGSSTD